MDFIKQGYFLAVAPSIMYFDDNFHNLKLDTKNVPSKPFLFSGFAPTNSLIKFGLHLNQT